MSATRRNRRERDEGPEVRAAEARQESMGGLGRGSPVRQGGPRHRAAGVGWLYFKWWGIYTQGDGLGVTGGVGGEGKATEFFMMRIGLPNGILTSAQLRVIGDLTKKYARNLADITTRQNIQLHWLTIESLPEVVDALTAVGLSPKGACGDVVRNVTGCPLAGLDGHELIDASSAGGRDGAQADGESRVLQPAAKVQDLGYRLPAVVLLPGDQRCCADCDQARSSMAEKRSAIPCAWAAVFRPSRTLPCASLRSSGRTRPSR